MTLVEMAPLTLPLILGAMGIAVGLIELRRIRAKKSKVAAAKDAL